MSRRASRTRRPARSGPRFRPSTDIRLESRILLARLPIDVNFPVGGYPPDLSLFAPIPETGPDRGATAGTFDAEAETDDYRFTAPLTGRLKVRVTADPGSEARPSLAVKSEYGYLVEYAYNDGTAGSVFATFQVYAGSTYFVRAFEGGDGTGAYTVSYAMPGVLAGVEPDFPLNPPDPATFRVIPLATDANKGSIAGVFEAPGDVAYYRFTPSQSGKVRIRLRATEGSDVRGSLAVKYDYYGYFQYLVGSQINDGDEPEVAAAISVEAGINYYVKVFEGNSGTGSYELVVDQPHLTRYVSITPDLSYVTEGAFEDPAEILDLMLSGEPGDIRVTVEPLPGSAFRGKLLAFAPYYDTSRPLTIGLDGSLTFDNHNRSPMIRLVPRDGSVGAYRLVVEHVADDYGDDHDNASSALNSNATIDGTLERPGDRDEFFLSTYVGDYTEISLAPSQGLSASASLEAFMYDPSRGTIRPWGTHPDGDPRRILLDVSGHSNYYVRVTTTDGLGVGAYRLSYRTYLTDQPGADTTQTAKLITPSYDVEGTIGPGEADVFRVRWSPGLFSALVHGVGVDTRLTLLDPEGLPVVAADRVSADDPDDRLALKLEGDSYFWDRVAYLYLKVESRDGRTGRYTLRADFAELDPLDPTRGNRGHSLVADFDGDGVLDVLGEGSYLLYGNGNGTFRPANRWISYSPYGILAADFNGDGLTDILSRSTISVGGPLTTYLRRADGSYESRITSSEELPSNLVVSGDFDGDGVLDLVTVASDGANLLVLSGRGDGSFGVVDRIGVGNAPTALVSADFNGDGRPDLAVTLGDVDAVAIFLSGDEGFRGTRIKVGSRPGGLALGDFNGDGRLDLVAANAGSDDLSILLNLGAGRFAVNSSPAAGIGPKCVAVGDFNGDGRLDLITANGSTTESRNSGERGSDDLGVLLGRGDGTFGGRTAFRFDLAPYFGFPGEVAVGDLNGDGRLDLITGVGATRVILGNGDGTFQNMSTTTAGGLPRGGISADFNGDGLNDLAVVNSASGDVSILLGRGDGTFEDQLRFPVGDRPHTPVVGDFNGDGRLDLAVTDEGSDVVSILLGRGDGTFLTGGRFAVGESPRGLVSADFDGDGIADLATSNGDSFDVTLLIGRGDGSFARGARISVTGGAGPLAAADLDGDGRVDLAIGSQATATILVALGRGDGTFRAPTRFEANYGPFKQSFGLGPTSVRAADVDGDGVTDLVVTTPSVYAVFPDGAEPGEGFSASLSVLFGAGKGRFLAPVQLLGPRGWQPPAFVDAVATDLDGDGRNEVVGIEESGNYWVFASQGRRFAYTAIVNAGIPRYQGTDPPRPLVLIASDFNGDGRPELASVLSGNSSIPVQMNLGANRFLAPGTIAPLPRATPILADLDGDGSTDLLIVATGGRMQFRRGEPGRPGSFEPTTTIAPGLAALDLATVPIASGTLIAATLAGSDAIGVFAARYGGGFERIFSLPTGRFPTRLISADLTGDGQADLLVYNAGDGTVTLFAGDGNGAFAPGVTIDVGLGVSDLAAADMDGDGRLDLVISNQIRDSVRVLVSRGGGLVPMMPRLTSPMQNVMTLSPFFTTSLAGKDGTSGVATGRFDGDAIVDVVTINPTSHTAMVLKGLSGGGYDNGRTLPIDGRPRAIRVADLDGDGRDDLAVLVSEGVEIFLGDGRGWFADPFRVDAGNAPTGLSIVDVDGDGSLDLVVGNPFGDILTLLGRGDGTFRPLRGLDGQVALAVADLDGDGRDDFIFADRGLDRVSVRYAGSASTLLGGRSDGLLAPGAVHLADLDGDGVAELIVVNSGSNNVLIYPGLGGGQFGPSLNNGMGFFTGSNPANLAIADLDDDGRPDLVVANTGSNDVSVLLNRRSGTGFTFQPGPRLQAGQGPVAATIADVNADGRPDILVSESGSGQVRLIHAVGAGFFDDRNPILYAVGAGPGPLYVGQFDARPGLDLVTLNAGSNDLTLISDFAGNASPPLSFSTGGLRPVAGLVGDFNRDGRLDLVVANNGDGRLALLLGGGTGPVVSAVLSRADIPRPSSLALAGVSGDSLRFYASTEGRESASLLAFLLPQAPSSALSGPGSTGLLFGGFGSPSPSLGAIQIIAQLSGLTDGSLALVASLVTLSLDSGAGPIDLELLAAIAPTLVSFLPSAAGESSPSEEAAATDGSASLPTQAVALRDNAAGEGEGESPPDEGDEEEDDELPDVEAMPGWMRFLLGVDEALEEGRKAMKEEALGPFPVPPVMDRAGAAIDAILSGAREFLDGLRHPLVGGPARSSHRRGLPPDIKAPASPSPAPAAMASPRVGIRAATPDAATALAMTLLACSARVAYPARRKGRRTRGAQSSR